MREIRIAEAKQQINAWQREITFNYLGLEYEVMLFWDQFNGYEIMWKRVDGLRMFRPPVWVEKWESEHTDSLAWVLDDLSESEVASVR